MSNDVDRYAAMPSHFARTNESGCKTVSVTFGKDHLDNGSGIPLYEKSGLIQNNKQSN